MMYYDDLRLFGKFHYSITWILIANFLFILQSVVFASLGTDCFILTRAVLTYGVVIGVPISLAFFHIHFPSYCNGLDRIIKFDREDFEDWVEDQGKEIFSFRNLGVLLSYLIVDLFVILIIILIKLPFNRTIILWIVIFLQPITFLGGHAFFFVYKVLNFFKNVSQSKLLVNFGRPPDLSVQGLLKFASRVSIVGFLLYLMHFISFFFTNYWNNYLIFIWMGFSAIFPLILFLYSTNRINILMKRMKFQSVDIISTEIQKVYKSMKNTPTKDAIEVLDLLFNIQSSLIKSDKVPFNLDGLVTLILTLIPVGVQLAIALVKSR